MVIGTGGKGRGETITALDDNRSSMTGSPAGTHKKARRGYPRRAR
jgi:hypothetical protein